MAKIRDEQLIKELHEEVRKSGALRKSQRIMFTPNKVGFVLVELGEKGRYLVNPESGCFEYEKAFTLAMDQYDAAIIKLTGDLAVIVPDGFSRERRIARKDDYVVQPHGDSPLIDVMTGEEWFVQTMPTSVHVIDEDTMEVKIVTQEAIYINREGGIQVNIVNFPKAMGRLTTRFF
ncbi:hypothetical protein CZP2022_35 [Vibrio phage C-ZP2022]|nr:hypothetical protein CZP2022_35 [Vibrio phage C-ZP2022]